MFKKKKRSEGRQKKLVCANPHHAPQMINGRPQIFQDLVHSRKALCLVASICQSACVSVSALTPLIPELFQIWPGVGIKTFRRIRIYTGIRIRDLQNRASQYVSHKAYQKQTFTNPMCFSEINCVMNLPCVGGRPFF